MAAAATAPDIRRARCPGLPEGSAAEPTFAGTSPELLLPKGIIAISPFDLFLPPAAASPLALIGRGEEQSTRVCDDDAKLAQAWPMSGRKAIAHAAAEELSLEADSFG